MDKLLLKVCNKDTKTKSLRHSLIIFIVNLESKFLSNRQIMAATSPCF